MSSEIFFILTVLLIEVLCNNTPLEQFKYLPFKEMPTIAEPENKITHQTRIFGGKPARKGQLPYQVGIFLKSDPDSSQGSWCGGTLISKNFVLTAAHCIVNSDSHELVHHAIVYLGITNRHDPYEISQGIRMKIPRENFIKHSEFDMNGIINDIALIKLPTPVQFNYYIRRAELPSRRQSRSDLVGKTITSSGWGHLGDPHHSPSILQYMNTKVIQGTRCARVYGRNMFNNRRQICINSSSQKSVCQGDSGGPNVINENGRATVIGVTSFGTQSCSAGYPQVLTRVSAYLDWISRQTGIEIKN